jgi:hypothetical protein
MLSMIDRRSLGDRKVGDQEVVPVGRILGDRVWPDWR